ncbi:MAG: recombinase family protein [Sphingomonadales bacterium]
MAAAMSGRPVIRCAIYTRKSSDEGLEQDFNSLDAQREACEAFIRSQAHEGWKCLPNRYDDGGYSGGSIERPALQQLMEDIREHRLDVVVIYKIDRLTRSLADFARLAELFDQYGVSFVSVTQPFNTTTSMGRLMLNVLLSFAQFEREITGERIRDKIAASKKKGMWMGGTVPMGYRVVDRALVVDEAEVETIKMIFKLYLEMGTVPALMVRLEELGVRTRARVVAGRDSGDRPFDRGHLYHLLSNPVYRGQIRHKKQVFEGTHQPIIDPATWDAVQALLTSNTQGSRQRRKRSAAAPSLLAGLLHAENGNRFIPSHANKDGQRHRYYVEDITASNGARIRRRRIPTVEIERAVKDAVIGFLGSPAKVLQALGPAAAVNADDVLTAAAQLGQALEGADETRWSETVEALIAQVVFAGSKLSVAMRRQPLLGLLQAPHLVAVEASDTFSIDVEIAIRTRGTRTKLVIGERVAPNMPDASLLKALIRAHGWFEQLATGQMNSVDAIAKSEGLTSSYVARVLPMAFLSPTITEQILEGTQPFELTADWLTLHAELPSAWADQEHIIKRIGSRP